jgi:hypothetical protein
MIILGCLSHLWGNHDCLVFCSFLLASGYANKCTLSQRGRQIQGYPQSPREHDRHKKQRVQDATVYRGSARLEMLGTCVHSTDMLHSQRRSV